MAILQRNGFKLWESSVNRRGGLLGRPVKLEIHNDQSDPVIARKLYQQMADSQNFNFMFAPFSSEISEAILPITEEHGYNLLASGASADRLWQKGYKHIFGLFTPASKIAVSFLEMATINNLKTIAITFADNSFSTDIAQGSKLWAERFGLEIVFFQNFQKNSANLTMTINAIKEINPDILIIGGHLEDAIAFRQATIQTGWRPKAFYAPQGPSLPAFQNRLGSNSHLVFSTSQWERLGGIHQPGLDSFIQEYKDTYNESPQYFAATAYAAGQILEAAISETQSFDHQEINTILKKLNFESIIGRYGVDQNGVQVKNFTLVMQIQKDGTREVVWPQILMTAKPLFE